MKTACLLKTILAAGIAASVTTARAELKIVMGASSGPANTALTVPVSVETDGNVVALQFDLVVNQAKADVGALSPSPALATHRLDFADIAAGRVRAVIHSIANLELRHLLPADHTQGQSA
jgi:hypothetical protein